ncbi:hypothetical protein [Bifidobacterium aerophilum]|uniref:Uncharacterized protein n=1 Tax=Bifidobacterium aerophilum TaxID=1798155 RepID=A0A6N9Z4D4_9BIFI|nr:hypothetical protein [Bifidobacterium aerophilum]NEG89290.1 hypothetical protein [Bifidobacterium aerophilum]
MMNDDVTFQHDDVCDKPKGVDDIHTQIRRLILKQLEPESGRSQMKRHIGKAGETHGGTRRCTCFDELNDLFAGSFPEGEGVARIAQVARDLKAEDAMPVPDAEQNAQYADTIDWLRDGEAFGDESSVAVTALSQVIRVQAEALLRGSLDYWAYMLVKFAKSRGFLLDERLACVWLCNSMMGVVKDMLEEQAGVAFGVGHTLTNIARAGGTSQSNVRTKWPNIREYADAYRAMKEDGGEHDVVIGDRRVTFGPSDDKEYMERAERIVNEHMKVRMFPDDDRRSEDGSYVDTPPVQHMSVGLKALSDSTDPESPLRVDQSVIDDLMKPGDCLWTRSVDGCGEGAVRRAINRTVKGLVMDTNLGEVHGAFMAISVPSEMLDMEQMNEALNVVRDTWPKMTLVWQVGMNEDESDKAVHVVMLAAGNKA